MITTVNYHLLQACNMSCNHCFAVNLSKDMLNTQQAVRLIRMLSKDEFTKINFAGGEPMLYPKLDLLIREAKSTGMVVSMVTNGTRITRKWLDGISGHLDWIAISVDSADPKIHQMSGRAVNGIPISREAYVKMCSQVREHNIRLKINTVVTLHNHAENMTRFIEELNPERWKIMQALPVYGQNDHNASGFVVTDEQFDAFVKRNRTVKDVCVIPENNRLMTGSYAMVDPQGRFFDNTRGTHTYSRPILEVGVNKALSDIDVYPEIFDERGGNYE